MAEFEITIDDHGLPERLQALAPKLRELAIPAGLREGALLLRRKIKLRMEGSVLKRRTGRLSRSVTQSEVERRGSVWAVTVGSAVSYARIHETGGVIRPVRARALAVPLPAALTASGVSRYPSPLRSSLRGAFPGGTFVHKGVLFGKPVGRRSRPVPLFALRQSVVIPARPIWGPVLRESQQEVAAILAAKIDETVRGTGA